MLAAIFQFGNFMFASSAGCENCVFVRICIQLFLRRNTINNGVCRKIFYVAVISVLICRLGNAAEETKGVGSFLQPHIIGVCRNRHHIDHAFIVAGSGQLCSYFFGYSLVGADYNNRLRTVCAVSIMLDIYHIYRVPDGTENRVIQTGFLISCAEKCLFVGVILSLFLLGEHYVIDERIVLAFGGKLRDQNNGFVLSKLILPAAWGKIWIRRSIFYIWIIIESGCLVWPVVVWISLGIVLFRGGRKIEDHVGGTCIIAETAEKTASGSLL